MSESTDEMNASDIQKTLFKVDVKVNYCKVCCLILNEEESVQRHLETNLHKDKINEEVSLTKA